MSFVAEVEETPRSLCYDAAAGQWKLLTTENGTATRPAVFAAQPAKEIDSRQLYSTV